MADQGWAWCVVRWQVRVRLGKAGTGRRGRPGWAGYGEARHGGAGTAWQGCLASRLGKMWQARWAKTRYGMAKQARLLAGQVEVWRGRTCCGWARPVQAGRQGPTWSGAVGPGGAGSGGAWHGRRGTIRSGKSWLGPVWLGRSRLMRGSARQVLLRLDTIWRGRLGEAGPARHDPVRPGLARLGLAGRSRVLPGRAR